MQTYADQANQGISGILQALVKLSQGAPNFNPVSAGERAGQAAVETPVGQNPMKSAGAAALNMGPYQKGVESALRKAGEAHAAEALSAGVPPTAIQSHSLMAPQGMSTGDPAQGAQTSPGNQQQALGILNQLGNFLFNPGGVDKATGQAQAPSLLGGLIQNRNPQAMLMRQQAANAIPSQQVALEKKKAEEVPPTQYEQSQLAAGGYTAQTTAVKDELERIKADKDQLETQLKTVLEHPMQSFASGMSAKDISKQLISLTKKEAEVHQKMFNLFGKQPNFKQGQGGNSKADPAAIAEAKRRGLI